MTHLEEVQSAYQAEIEELADLVEDQKDLITNLENEIEKLRNEGNVIIDQLRDIIKYNDNF